MFRKLWPFKKAKTIEEEHREDLHTLLSGLEPSNSFEDRMETLRKIMAWLRVPVTISEKEVTRDAFQSRNLRLRFLIQYLDRHPPEAENFFTTFKELTSPGMAVRLYCHTGIPENVGFFNELSDRIIQNVLPPTFREKDLAEFFKLIFVQDEDAEWFETNAFEIIPPFLALMNKYEVKPTGVVLDQSDSLVILGAHLASLGISKNVRRHLKQNNITDSSFIKLAMAINRQAADEVILNEIKACRMSLGEIRRGVEQTGVSVELIYHLEKIEAYLNRVELLLYLRHPTDPDAQALVVARFIGRMIRDELMGMRVKDYLKQNLHLLTRKIVERAGDKGDIYIAGNAEERRHLFAAACWAGVLTAFTAFVKYWIGEGHFPLFIEGFFFFVNYALGFMGLQYWHMALSSKVPAYMASALSKKFEIFVQTKKLSPVINEVRKVTHSQIIATAGNLLLVIPVCTLVNLIWILVTGSSMINQATAMDIIEKHELFSSMTIFYAFLTGVFLWLSSVVAGWTENWVVYRNLPAIIKESRSLKAIFGKELTSSVAENFSGVVGGIAGNLAIAAFLAFPIIIGKMTGLPLDIRHATLATGTITFALNSLGFELAHWPIYLNMLASITVIAILNFGISFYCALRMAAIARNVDSKYMKVIFKFSFSRYRTKASGHEEV